MLAVNVTASVAGTLDGRGSDVQECARRWWVISEATLKGYGDQLLAVADNRVVGVYAIRGWSRDPNAANKVVLDLDPAGEWQWLVGQDSPVTWARGQANPVRKVEAGILSSLNDQRPVHLDAGQGWSLDVDEDGRTATVRGPSSAVIVTSVGNGAVRLAIQ